MKPTEVSPAEWGAAKPYDRWTDRHRYVRELYLHWGGNPVRAAAAAGDVAAEKAQLRSWESYHVNTLGWRGLAYDYAIGNSGTLYRIRGRARSGATSGDRDRDAVPNNLEGDAVVFIVGQGQTVSPAALATFAAFEATHPHPDGVYGHREARGTSTSCPGPQLLAVARDVRAGVTHHTTPEPTVDGPCYLALNADVPAAAGWLAASRNGWLATDIGSAVKAHRAGADVIAVGGPAAAECRKAGIKHEAVSGADRQATYRALGS